MGSTAAGVVVYISIHTLRMEGDEDQAEFAARIAISIHTLRMEGDYPVDIFQITELAISIHTLRMEGDVAPSAVAVHVADFNPHPPHGG